MSTNIAGVPIDFGPIVQEPDDVSSITGKYQMPCGCKLTQKVINKGSFGSSVATAEFIDMAKKRLIYWFEKRIPWHQCHLVASENPNGIISKDLRSNRTPPFGYLNVAVPMMRDGSPADPEKFGVIVVHTNAPETPPIPAYQQRVLDEKRELDEKLEKLRTFIDGSPVFSGLPATDQSHLKSQLAVMEVYSCILADRIARFGGAA